MISGGGSTMEAMARACQEGGELEGMAKPVVVIASREDIAGIQRAESFDIPVEIIIKRDYPNEDAYGDALISILARYSPDVITLNGFLVKIPSEVIFEYENQIYNQHPGPVPEFGGAGMYGRRVHAAVLAWNRMTKQPDPQTWMIAQRVAVEYDMGAVVLKEPISIANNDTVDSLQARCLPVEHKLQIKLLEGLAQGNISEIPYPNLLHTETDLVVLEQVKEVAKALYPTG